MEYRNGEDTAMHFRSERFYAINCEWFFTTREGREIGPFQTHQEAEVELMLYIRHLDNAGFTREHYFVTA